MSKCKVYILADGYQNYLEGIERCKEQQEDFLDVYEPFWCPYGEPMEELCKEKVLFIDCRKSSLMLQNYNIEYSII